MRNVLLVIVFFVLFLVFFSLVFAGKEIDVNVKVIEGIENIEEGDVVEITNELFEGEEAEVVSVDKEKEEAVVSMLTGQAVVNLSDLRIVRKKEQGILEGNVGVFIILFVILVFLIVLFLLREKRIIKEWMEKGKKNE